MRRAFLAVVTSILIAALSGIESLALDRSSMAIEAGPQKTFDRKTYPALIGVWPRNTAAGGGISGAGETRGVTRCKVLTYCDSVPLVIKGVDPSMLYQVGITLTWTSPDRRNERGEVIRDSEGRTQKENNLDIILFEEIVTTTENKDGSKSTASAFNVIDASPLIGRTYPDLTFVWHPEFLKAADLPPTGEIRELALTDPKTQSRRYEQSYYWIVPYNFEGTNQGYTLTVEFAIQTPEERAAGMEPTFVFPFEKSGSLSRSSSPPTPEATPPSVKLPGADGPVSEHDVVPLKGIFARTAGGLGASGIVLIVGLLLAAGLGTFFVVRRRRQAAAKP